MLFPRQTTVGARASRCALLLVVVLLAGGGLRAQPVPRIDPAYPPQEDLRRPDMVLAAAAEGPASAIAYSADGRLLATGGTDGAVRTWNARPGDQELGQRVSASEGHRGRVWAVGFSADGKTLRSAGADHLVKVWAIPSGKLVRSFFFDTEKTGVHLDRRTLFSPGDDAWLAATSDDEVCLVNYETGERIRHFDTAGRHITALAFSPDGKRLGSACSEGEVRVWDLAGNAPDEHFDAGCAVEALAVGADQVLAGCVDGRVKVAPLGRAAELRVIGEHSGPVHAAAISAKSDLWATAGVDASIRVWDTTSGRLLCQQVGDKNRVVSVAFSSNGQKLASGDEAGAVTYWTVPLPPVASDVLAKIAAAIPPRATAAPKKPRRLLVFWRADAILHKAGVPAVNHAIEMLGEKTGAFTTEFSRDYEVFDPAVLARYDAIVLNSTAHITLPSEAMKRAFLDYVRGGGGVIGIHAAIDMFKNWPEGARVVGATFGGHPWVPSGTWAVKLEEPAHPLARAWAGKNFSMHDEFYELDDPYTRADRRVLMSLDLTDHATASVTPLHRTDRDFAVSWIKHYGKGHVFYSMFGHLAEPLENPAVLQYDLDGIQYALGDLDVDDAPVSEKKP